MSTGSLYPEVKRPERGVDQPRPSSVDVNERIELYIYSPSGPSLFVLGWTSPLPNFLIVCLFTSLSLCSRASFVHFLVRYLFLFPYLNRCFNSFRHEVNRNNKFDSYIRKNTLHSHYKTSRLTTIIIIIIINIKDWTLWSVPSPELQLLVPTLLRSSNCSPSLWSVVVWFQRDSVLWHSLQVLKPVPSVFIYLV